MHKLGFVFGKFYPPHTGHLKLLHFARSQCERLVVLICCSTREAIPPEVRRSWFADCVDTAVEFHTVVYDEAEYPNTSVPSKDVARTWAALFRTLVPEATLLVTSEAYGPWVAQYMGITHVFADPPRNKSLSATTLRKDLAGQWPLLAPGARRWFQKTVVVCGTESTGKSTLARVLAQRFGGTLVEEVGRELVPDSNTYSREQLQQVAARHAANIEAARAADTPVVVVDTDVYITQSYANFAFGRYLDLPEATYAANRADLRLYLAADAPFHQDGTRLDQAARTRLDACHRATLRYFAQDWLELNGHFAPREERAIEAVAQLFDLRWRC